MNELEHAQFYSEYGRMAVETDEGLRPFQVGIILRILRLTDPLYLDSTRT